MMVQHDVAGPVPKRKSKLKVLYTIIFDVII